MFLTATGNGALGQSLARRGFTLVELLVVLAIIATLLAIAAPQFAPNVGKAKEAVLKEDLSTIRDAIDKYYGDQGSYPEKLDDLVARQYLRRIPVDPLTGSATTWVLVPPAPTELGHIFDIRSGAVGHARDGSEFGSW